MQVPWFARKVQIRTSFLFHPSVQFLQRFVQRFVRSIVIFTEEIHGNIGRIPSIPPITTPGDIDVAKADVDTLHFNAIGVTGLVAGAAGAVAPLAAMFFNVPLIVDQAGAAVPLVFLISAIGMILFAVSIVYFARRISWAGGLYTWVSHGLGKGAGFYAGWLMLGGYALFEAAAAAVFGGLTDNTLSSIGFSMPGGWVTYTLLALLIVSLLTYFDVKVAARILIPFLALEILSLLVVDVATLIHGGANGWDFVHIFTTAGSAIKGVFPGGVLGIGVGMALGIWSFVGFEQGVAFGEEVKFPHRAIPWGLFGVVDTPVHTRDDDAAGSSANGDIMKSVADTQTTGSVENSEEPASS